MVGGIAHLLQGKTEASGGKICWECMEETVQAKEVVEGKIFREVRLTRIIFVASCHVILFSRALTKSRSIYFSVFTIYF